MGKAQCQCALSTIHSQLIAEQHQVAVGEREYGLTLKGSERGRGLVWRVVSDHEAGAGPLLESPDRLLGCWIDPAQLAFAPPSLPPSAAPPFPAEEF